MVTVVNIYFLSVDETFNPGEEDDDVPEDNGILNFYVFFFDGLSVFHSENIMQSLCSYYSNSSESDSEMDDRDSKDERKKKKLKRHNWWRRRKRKTQKEVILFCQYLRIDIIIS